MGREARRNGSAEKSAAHGHQKPERLTFAAIRDRRRVAGDPGKAVLKALGFLRVPAGAFAVKETT